jgi:hypothetical protein
LPSAYNPFFLFSTSYFSHHAFMCFLLLADLISIIGIMQSMRSAQQNNKCFIEGDKRRGTQIEIKSKMEK